MGGLGVAHSGDAVGVSLVIRACPQRPLPVEVGPQRTRESLRTVLEPTLLFGAQKPDGTHPVSCPAESFAHP